MRLPRPEDVARNDEERELIEARDRRKKREAAAEQQKSPSDRYRELSQHQMNHRSSLSDLPGRSTVDMMESMPPSTFSRRSGRR